MQRRARFNDDEFVPKKENEIEDNDFNVQQAKPVFMTKGTWGFTLKARPMKSIKT